MEHPLQSSPALPTAHDGAVQEVLAYGGPQHPQQQAHQQEARVLPEGEARAPGTSLMVSQFFFFPKGGVLWSLWPVLFVVGGLFAPQPLGSTLLSASLPSPQGENPFTDSPEEEKEQEEAEGSALDEGLLVQATGGTEGAEGTPAQPPIPPEPATGHMSPPPLPPPEEDEEAMPLLGGTLQRQICGIPGLDVGADDDDDDDDNDNC